MPASDWTILCDFDGTIAVEDVIDSLLERYGRPGWEALELDWRAGRIGSRDCMSGQVALLDTSRNELDAHLAAACGYRPATFTDRRHAPPTAHFASSMAACQGLK